MRFYQLLKIAGGPGSGVSKDNTKKIDMPLSEYISIGKRKKQTEGVKSKSGEVPFSKIKKVCQEKYVPKKFNKMVKNWEKWNLANKPVDMLKVSDDEYHVIDGHHRFLAAKKKGEKKLKANIYNKNKIKEASLTSENKIPDFLENTSTKHKKHKLPAFIDNAKKSTLNKKANKTLLRNMGLGAVIGGGIGHLDDRRKGGSKGKIKGALGGASVGLLSNAGREFIADKTDKLLSHKKQAMVELGLEKMAQETFWDEMKSSDEYGEQLKRDGRIAEIAGKTSGSLTGGLVGGGIGHLVDRKRNKEDAKAGKIIGGLSGTAIGAIPGVNQKIQKGLRRITNKNI